MTDQQIIRYSLLAVFLIVAIAYYLITHSTGKKRSEAMKKLAETMSYTYEAAGHQDLIDSAYRLPLFSQGHSKKLSNLITGNYNRLPFTLADFQYVINGGKNSSTRRQTIVIIDLEKLDLPYFKLQPKNIFHKIGRIFKKKDIDFESYQQFSQRYFLTGEDETAIRRVFNDSLLSYFENHLGLNVEANRHQMMFYRSAKLVQPAQMQGFLQQGYDIFNLIAGK